MIENDTKIAQIDGFLADRPISCTAEDQFDAERIAEKLQTLMEEPSLSSITILLSGPWGSGKSSVLNLLQNRLEQKEKSANIYNKLPVRFRSCLLFLLCEYLKKYIQRFGKYMSLLWKCIFRQKFAIYNKTQVSENKNKTKIIINFEPLLEGKLDLPNILKLFYLQLHQKIDQEIEIKKIIKNIVSAISINCSIFSLSFEKFMDCKENKSYVERTKELNELLKEKAYKIYIIIDELDRLPAESILNFLLFTRVLEQLTGFSCIVAMDYEQVLKKLMYSGVLNAYRASDTNSSDNYRDAQSYLDKLFQYQITLYTQHDIEALKRYCDFSLKSLFSGKDKELIRIIKEKILDESDDNANLLFYLGTIRNIKKWLIEIKLAYNLLQAKYFGSDETGKVAFIKLLIVVVQHPIAKQILSKRFLKSKESNNLIKLTKDLDPQKKKIIDFQIQLGVDPTNSDYHKSYISYIQEKIKYEGELHITCLKTQELARNIQCQLDAGTLPEIYLILYLEGYNDKTLTKLFGDFFEGEENQVNQVLNTMSETKERHSNDMLRQLSAILQKFYNLNIKNQASYDAIKEFYLRRGCHEGIKNILYIVLNKFSMLSIIENLPIGLSYCVLSEVFSSCGLELDKEFMKFDFNKANALAERHIDSPYNNNIKYNISYLMPELFYKAAGGTENNNKIFKLEKDPLKKVLQDMTAQWVIQADGIFDVNKNNESIFSEEHFRWDADLADGSAEEIIRLWANFPCLVNSLDSNNTSHYYKILCNRMIYELKRLEAAKVPESLWITKVLNEINRRCAGYLEPNKSISGGENLVSLLFGSEPSEEYWEIQHILKRIRDKPMPEDPRVDFILKCFEKVKKVAFV